MLMINPETDTGRAVMQGVMKCVTQLVALASSTHLGHVLGDDKEAAPLLHDHSQQLHQVSVPQLPTHTKTKTHTYFRDSQQQEVWFLGIQVGKKSAIVPCFPFNSEVCNTHITLKYLRTDSIWFAPIKYRKYKNIRQVFRWTCKQTTLSAILFLARCSFMSLG